MFLSSSEECTVYTDTLTIRPNVDALDLITNTYIPKVNRRTQNAVTTFEIVITQNMPGYDRHSASDLN